MRPVSRLPAALAVFLLLPGIAAAEACVPGALDLRDSDSALRFSVEVADDAGEGRVAARTHDDEHGEEALRDAGQEEEEADPHHSCQWDCQ